MPVKGFRLSPTGGAGGGEAGSNTLGMSNLGNTSGTTGVISGSAIRYLFAGGNNVTLSQSLDGVSGTVTVSAFNQTGSQYSAGISTIGNTAGNTGLASQRLVLAGGNNITLSGSTDGGSMTVTVSGAAGGEAGSNTLGMSNLGNTAGTTGIVSGSAIRYLFAGGNNVTLSQSLDGVSGTVTVSAFNQTVESQSVGMSNLGNTSGTTGIASGAQIRYLLAGDNQITISQSLDGASGTASISGANPGAQNMSFWQNAIPASTDNAVNRAITYDSLFFFPLDIGNNIFAGNMTVETVLLGMTNNYTQSSKPFTSSFLFGLYTVNGTQLSLINSISTTWGVSQQGTQTVPVQSSLYQGKRFLTMNSSLASAQLSMRQSLYYGAWLFRSSSNSNNASLYGAVFLESGVRSGTMGVGTTTGQTIWGGMPFHGVYSASTSALPESIANEDLRKTEVIAYFVPHLIFNNLQVTTF